MVIPSRKDEVEIESKVIQAHRIAEELGYTGRVNRAKLGVLAHIDRLLTGPESDMLAYCASESLRQSDFKQGVEYDLAWDQELTSAAKQLATRITVTGLGNLGIASGSKSASARPRISRTMQL
jgi:hypothetical protein